MCAVVDETSADRRRCAKQINQQPKVTAEIADQTEVARGFKILQRLLVATLGLQGAPKIIGQAEVVVNAGDSLHGAAVAMAEPNAIHRFHLAAIGCAVARNRDFIVAAEDARHARGPEALSIGSELL